MSHGYITGLDLNFSPVVTHMNKENRYGCQKKIDHITLTIAYIKCKAMWSGT